MKSKSTTNEPTMSCWNVLQKSILITDMQPTDEHIDDILKDLYSMTDERPRVVHPASPSRFQFNDGGRAGAGFKGTTGDCVTRAIAIATGRPYRDIYDELNSAISNFNQSPHRKKPTRGSSRTGVARRVYHDFILTHGFTWHPIMTIGAGCRVHLRPDELPSGTLICRCSRHLVAVINGVVHDTFDSTRNGTRCVYGYYKKIK